MKYYFIVGEASGDIHASHLMAAIRKEDAGARFRGFGGDMMAAEGAELVQHYRDLAYMGVIPVLMHIGTILQSMKRCKEDILAWKPDVVILVDYPSFNLKVAHFLKKRSDIRIFYYIAPKIWAWKEWRIKNIRRDVDAVFSILPFEMKYFKEKHHHQVHYVGNPTVDEVYAYLKAHPADAESFRRENNLDTRPIIALLAGSRKQEVRGNLRRMAEAAAPYGRDYQLVLAAAPGLDADFYRTCAAGLEIHIVRNQTYRLLQHSTAALVTSGTATLETALFRVPQVVCYYMRWGRLVSFARKLALKIPYISLVNLVAGEDIVPELVAEQMNPVNVRRCLADILPGGSKRQTQLEGYERMAAKLGEIGASRRAARQMVQLLKPMTSSFDKNQEPPLTPNP